MTRYPKPLKNRAKQLLQVEVPKTEPPIPVSLINDDRCELRNNSAALRNLFILPWLIGLCFTLYLHIDDFIATWKSTEQSEQKYISRKKRIYGENYFENNPNPIALERFKILNEKGELTFKRYLHYNYFETADAVNHPYRALIIDIGLLLFYSLAIPGLLYWAIRFPRHAPLIFDRQRGLVYHWAKGNVFVQRYDRLRIDELTQYLMFQLRGRAKNGDLGWAEFRVQPTGNPFFNGSNSYKPVLAYIVQFMEHGRAHLLPDQESWQDDKQGFFFFDDEKPANFEQQMNELLTRMDEANDEIPLDEEGDPIPPSDS